MYEVIFYRERNGKEPIKEYLEQLEAKRDRSKDDRIRFNNVIKHIAALETYGTMIGEPYVKHIGDGIWELRPIKDRIFFFYWKGNKYVLLHHFIKKTQKTPKREIDMAIKNRNDYLERV